MCFGPRDEPDLLLIHRFSLVSSFTRPRVNISRGTLVADRKKSFLMPRDTTLTGYKYCRRKYQYAKYLVSRTEKN